jgi:Fe-S-cluster containining protein
VLEHERSVGAAVLVEHPRRDAPQHVGGERRDNRARYLKQGGITFGSIDGGRTMYEVWSQFYSCDQFDPESRRCTAYADRPPMCRDYPWYGDPADPAKALPDTCTHLTEIGRQPVPVEITSRRP